MKVQIIHSKLCWTVMNNEAAVFTEIESEIWQFSHRDICIWCIVSVYQWPQLHLCFFKNFTGWSLYLLSLSQIKTKNKNNKKQNVDTNNASILFKPTKVIALYCADGLSGNNEKNNIVSKLQVKRSSFSRLSAEQKWKIEKTPTNARTIFQTDRFLFFFFLWTSVVISNQIYDYTFALTNSDPGFSHQRDTSILCAAWKILQGYNRKWNFMAFHTN